MSIFQVKDDELCIPMFSPTSVVSSSDGDSSSSGVGGDKSSTTPVLHHNEEDLSLRAAETLADSDSEHGIITSADCLVSLLKGTEMLI